MLQWPMVIVSMTITVISVNTTMTTGHCTRHCTRQCYNDQWSLQQWPSWSIQQRPLVIVYKDRLSLLQWLEIIIWHWILIFSLIGRGDCGIFTIINDIAWLRENLFQVGLHRTTCPRIESTWRIIYGTMPCGKITTITSPTLRRMIHGMMLIFDQTL